MSLTEDLADKLAADTLAAMERTGDDRLYLEVGKAIGVLSPSMQEAFLSSCRLMLAAGRGRRFLDERMAQAMAPDSGRDNGHD
ncbi:hypothetical protein [Paenirhodobacter enshiensis]|uniref:hypothetical protein n=1 Tax=Paenirhodobacter enshiensis TaxID=1105367 RepID=UPI0035B1DA49